MISSVLIAHASVATSTTKDLLPVTDLKGKLYEAHVLSRIIENLHTRELCTISLAGISSTTLTLKRKGSDITNAFAYFEVVRNGVPFGEIYTDTYFSTLSLQRTTLVNTNPATYHELDIVMVPPGTLGRPDYKIIMLAVECKATLMQKSIFREVLGFRKEMGGRKTAIRTAFNHWPVLLINNDPGSVHLFYCSSSGTTKYQVAGEFFGILVEHEPL
jgi:hypothetical protein